MNGFKKDDLKDLRLLLKELKDFERVSLKAGESKTVTLDITPEKLSFYDINMDFMVEPGDFAILVGTSSDDKNLQEIKLKVK